MLARLTSHAEESPAGSSLQIVLEPSLTATSGASQLWVHDGERMVLAPVSVAPGLYKIFDEILVNAADNKARDPKMDALRVDIDPVSGPGSISSECFISFCMCCTGNKPRNLP